jgi:outer membrane protein OmpA-like peptidoglycan-associated protein
MVLSACSLSKSIKDGKTAHAQKQYAVAVEMLESQIESVSDPAEYAELAYLLGESYKFLNDSENSLKWFIEAAQNGYGADAFWEMAYALKKKERYEDAILSFLRLEKMTSRTELIRKEIEKCRQARKWTDSRGEHNYILEPLLLNTPESDYAPYVLNGRFLVFTSDRREAEGETYQWTGNSFSDLYISEIGQYDVTRFEAPVNSEHNEGTATFSTDGDEIYYTRCFSEVGDSHCRIMRSLNLSGAWTAGEPAFRMKSGVNYGDPMLIENDEVLIFSSNDPTGIGGHDLYYSVREDDGTWSDPELMPPYLNTIGEERFPTWDGQTLYFSSDHLPGLGGLDIYKTSLQEDGSWSSPENLLQPINSSEDDYSYVIVPEEVYPENVILHSFFTSTRGVYGNDDIYSLTELRPEGERKEEAEEEVEIAAEEPVSKSLFLRVKVTEKIFAMPDNPNSYVVGKRSVEGASLKVGYSENEDVMTTDDNGFVLLELDTLFTYDLLAGKRGYLNKGEAFDVIDEDLSGYNDGHIFDVELEIERIFEGVEITLENIYYDFDEYFIREDAKPALNYLIEVLDDNPAIRIELSSHTDCRGEVDYNQELSQNRATAAINYISDTGGIDISRLRAVGYGESRPEITCLCEDCSEDEHQINRRTTFKILQNG